LTVFVNELVRGVIGRPTHRSAAKALVLGRPDLRRR
jgi:hypothetical protein